MKQKKKRGPEEFLKAVMEKKLFRVWIRSCSICKTPIGFIFYTNPRKVATPYKVMPYWDGSCRCGTVMHEPQARSWQDVAEIYNASPEEVQTELDQKFMLN